MSQVKVTFAAVISVIIVLFYSYFVFLGLVYWYNGGWVKALLLTLIFIAVVLMCLTLMCRGRSSRWKGLGVSLQVVFGLVALLALLASSFPFSHFFNVVDQQSKITEAFEQTRTYAQGIESAYAEYTAKRERAMVDYLTTVEAGGGRANPAEHRKIFGTGLTKNSYIEQYDMLLKLSGPDSLAHVNQMRWLDQVSKMSVWNIAMPNNIAKLNQAVNTWKDSYVSKSQQKAYPDENYPPFEYTAYSEKTQELNTFLTKMKTPVWWSVLAALLCFGIILLPYFLIDPPTTGRGGGYDTQAGI